MDNFEKYNNVVQEWIRGTFDNRGRDAEATLKYCNEILKYGKENQDDKLLGFAYYYEAETFYILNDTESFFKNVMTALSYLDNSRQWELMARAYNFMAITSMNRGNAPFAMDYYLSALAYCNKYKIDDVGTMVNINIGTLYHNFGDDFQAQHYFDVSLSILEEYPDMPDRDELLMNVYLGVANTYLIRDFTDKAQEYVEKARKKCDLLNDRLASLCCRCFMARLYHAEGKLKFRDECIEKVSELAGKEMPVLDVFEDLYEYCSMLLSAGKYEELWEMLTLLEELAKQAKITNLQKKILSLKIKYYKIKEDHAGYLQAAGLYYELSELLEKENSYMIGKMLNIRNFLEESTKQQKQMEMENKKLHVRSETDALTGLANRFRLNDFAEEAFRQAMAKKSTFAIEILDIDYFKQFNDNYGHQAGDTCIYKVAKAIEEMEDNGNIFTARYGGDEFVLVYSGYSKEAIQMLTSELKQKVLGLHIEHKFSSITEVVSISQGACWGVPSTGEKVWDYLHTADAMLYKVKSISRNSTYVGEYGEG